MFDYQFISIIWLTRGHYTIVDNEDYESVASSKWYLTKSGYARSSEWLSSKGKGVFLHRRLINLPAGKFVDHINRDRLDNRKANLRECEKWQNGGNKKLQTNNTSGFKGVTFKNREHRFVGKIKIKDKNIHLGGFKCPIEAAKAYDVAALQYFGEFALTNKMLGLLE